MAISRGEEAAFNRFFAAFSNRIHRYLMVLSKGNEALAKEAHQESLLRCARHLKPMPTEVDLWRWLTRVMRTAYIDVIRSQKKSCELKELVPDDFMSDERQEEEQEQLLQRLNQGLAVLDEGSRKLLEDYYFEGVPQKALAVEHDMSARAVGMRISRIRQKLRDFILKGGGND